MRLEDSNVRSFMKVLPVSTSQDAYILHLKKLLLSNQKTHLVSLVFKHPTILFSILSEHVPYTPYNIKTIILNPLKRRISYVIDEITVHTAIKHKS